MKIQEISINAIKPYWRNARNNEKTIDALKESILQYGFNQPLVLDKNHVIIAGHSRYKAALQLDYKKVPCIITDMSEEKAKEYRIADNKIHDLSEWDTTKLVQELREVNLGNMDIYFPEIDLADLVKESAGISVQPITADNISEVQNTSQNQMHNHSNKVTESYRQLACPHCGEEFSLTENDLRTALGK